MSAGVALGIARWELERVLRDRTMVLFAVVLPVVVILVIGLTFGSSPDRLPLAVLDQDRTPASARLVAAFEASDGFEVVDAADERSLRRDVRTAAATGGLVVPAGYGDALVEQGSATVSLVTDPTSAATSALITSANGVLASQGAVLAGTDAAEAAGLDRPEAILAAERAAEAVVPVAVTDRQVGGDGGEVGSFDFTVPANLTLFVFVNLLAAGGALAQSRRLGVLRRTLVAPVRPSTVLFGIGASRVALGMVQAVLIVVVGAVLFGVRWGDPVGVAAVVVLWAAVGGGAGLLIGTLVRQPEQAPAIGVPVAIALGMLGGCMWPLEVVPPAMATVGHATPHAWAMDAWTTLVLDGGAAGDVAVELAVLTAWAVGLLALGSWRLDRSLRR